MPDGVGMEVENLHGTEMVLRAVIHRLCRKFPNERCGPSHVMGTPRLSDVDTTTRYILTDNFGGVTTNMNFRLHHAPNL
jgi:hypothetical protein